MPPRDTVGRSDRGPTRSRRTSKQIKTASKAKIAAARSRSRASERRKKAAKRAAAKTAAIAKIKAAEKAAANKAAEAAKRGPSATRAAVERRKATAVGSGRGSGKFAPTPYQTRERVRTRAANQAASAARSSRSGMQTGRGAAGQRPVAGGRGRTVERPGERAAALAAQRSRSIPRVKPQPRPEGMSLSRAKAGLYNLLPEFLRTDNKSKRTAKQQAFHDSIHGADARRKRRRRRKDSGGDQVVPPKPREEVDPYDVPPEIVDEFPPVMPPVMPPQFPQYPGMGGGIGAFGYSPALMAFESQQGAGQVPYYMAAARNAQTPNMSPAFQYAAQNYDILGGMQRTAPRPMEMMSAAERAQIAGMSNFRTPNYNSPYDQFNFFSNMVGGGGGKGMGRPMPQMGSGLGAFYGGFA